MWLSRLPALLAILLWGWFVVSGISILASVAAQQVPGYPNDGQRMLYLYIPLLMAGLAIALFAASWRVRQGGWHGALGCLSLLLIAAVLPFLIVAGGGV